MFVSRASALACVAAGTLAVTACDLSGEADWGSPVTDGFDNPWQDELDFAQGQLAQPPPLTPEEQLAIDQTQLAKDQQKLEQLNFQFAQGLEAKKAADQAASQNAQNATARLSALQNGESNRMKHREVMTQMAINHNEWLRGQLPRLIAETQEVWGRVRLLHAEARGAEAKAVLREEVTAQSLTIGRAVTKMVNGAVGKWELLTEVHELAADTRSSGVVHIHSLKQYFEIAAEGTNQAALAVPALKDLLATQPREFAGIIDPNGEIRQIPASEFEPLANDTTLQRFTLKTPFGERTNDCELTVLPDWDFNYSATVRVFAVDRENAPNERPIHEARIRRLPGIGQKHVIALYYPLDPGTPLFIEIEGGGISPPRADTASRGKRVPLNPTFKMSRTNRRKATPGRRLQRPVVHDVPHQDLWQAGFAQAFPGGTIVDLVAFAHQHNLRLKGKSRAIYGAVLGHTEVAVRERLVTEVTKILELRDAMLKFTLEALSR